MDLTHTKAGVIVSPTHPTRSMFLWANLGFSFIFVTTNLKKTLYTLFMQRFECKNRLKLF